MVDFGRALAGGIAGMAGAAGEVFEGQIKAKAEDRRAAILEKREKSLATFRHGLTLERDESRDLRQDEITKGQREYDEGQKESAWEAKKAELDYRLEGDLKLQDRRNAGASIAKPAKVSVSEKKEAKQNAMAGIESMISSYEPYFDPTKKAYELNIEGKSKEEVNSILTYMDSKGFQFNAQKPDEGTLIISLGEFDYDKYQESLDPSAKSAYEEVVEPEKESKTSFDSLFNALEKNKKVQSTLAPSAAPGSNLNTEIPNFQLESSHGLAAPKLYPIDNSQRPR